MNKDSLSTTLKDLHHIFLGNLCLALHDNLITLDRNHLTRILIHEVFVPALQHTGCQLRTNNLLQGFLVNLNLFGKIENLQDIFISLETDGSQQGGYGQLLLTIDVGIHHVVDIRSELNP